MRKFLAIKIQCNSYMYFPRLPPRPVKPGQVPELGTRAEAKFDIRFCHFWWFWVQTPGGAKSEKVLFFTFFFFSSQVKARYQNPSVINSPKGFQVLWYLFFLFFPSLSPDYRRPPRGYSISFFTRQP